MPQNCRKLLSLTRLNELTTRLGHTEILSAETSSVRVWQTMYSQAFEVLEARPDGFGGVSLRSRRKAQERGGYRLESSPEIKGWRTQGGMTPLNWRIYIQGCLVTVEVIGGDEVDQTRQNLIHLPLK